MKRIMLLALLFVSYVSPAETKQTNDQLPLSIFAVLLCGGAFFGWRACKCTERDAEERKKQEKQDLENYIKRIRLASAYEYQWKQCLEKAAFEEFAQMQSHHYETGFDRVSLLDC